MKKALAARPTLEMRQRIEKLLDRLATIVPLPPEILRNLRALEVLEEINTPEARQIIETLTKGAAHARVTQDAQATMGRLNNIANR